MKIDPKPKRPPATRPDDPRYWDPIDLTEELRRVFEVCHNCRMCVNYCGSFPDLFARVDRDIETRGAHGAERLDAEDFRSVTELCWQCKLCYIKCPYTPDEGHEWALDFPRVLTREKAQRAQRNGVTFQDAVLGEPHRLGELGSGVLAPIANLVSSQRLLRKVAAKTTGISEEFPLPPFARTSFERWLEHHRPQPEAGSSGTVALFATCTGDFNFPRVPASATSVLEKNGFRVTRPPQTCCGIPNLDGGDLDAARQKAAFNVESLHEALEQGHAIVAVGPTCAYTIKKEWPELLDSEKAARVAKSTMDIMEFLDNLRKNKTLNKEFQKGAGKVAYHAACHLRAQKIGIPGARLLKLLPDTEVEIVEQCSAVDGTWGMKEQHYEMGRKYAQKLVRGIEDASPNTVVTDCSLAGQRILKERGETARHPVEILAECYGLDQGPSA